MTVVFEKFVEIPKKSVKKPILEDNLGLAYSAALAFVQPRRVAVEDTEEYADALEALWKACSDWSEEKNINFSTYAHHCMRNAILNGIRDRKRKSVSAASLEDEQSKELPDVRKLPFAEDIDVHALVESLFAEVPEDWCGDCRSKAEKAKRNKYFLFQHYMKNVRWEELGRKFGVSKNRAYQYGQKAIKLLRE